MATQIKLRRDTAANWTSTNPVLALGEPGLEIDTRKIKYGDGTTAWTSLAYSAGDANFSGNYTDLSNKPTIPTDVSDLTDTTSLLGGGATNEITNTDGTSTYSVSVATTGVVTMTTGRGGIEFGAMPEIGGPTHLHIMRPAGQNGSTDLFFGDDFNYVKLPGLYGADPSTQQGVEIGSSFNAGPISVWKFGTDGNLTLPSGGDILNSTGTSVLFNGDYTNLTNKPTIPTDISNLTDTTNLLGAGGGIALTDLSVGADNPASGSGDFSYDNTTGIFTFTPPDLTGYVTGTPWTSAGYLTSTDLTQYISVSALKTLVADSTDFADFKTRIAAL